METNTITFGALRARTTLGPLARLLDWVRFVPLPDTRKRHLALLRNGHVRIVDCAMEEASVARKRGSAARGVVGRQPQIIFPQPPSLCRGLGGK